MLKTTVIAGLTTICMIQAMVHAQNGKSADSLFMVKSYLQQIQKTVENKQLTTANRISQLNALIQQGSWYQEVLARTIASTLQNNSQEQNNLIQQYRFIIQSAILYKTDLRSNNNHPGSNSNEEVRYLKQHIPPLIHKINQNAGYLKQKRVSFISLLRSDFPDALIFSS